MNSSNIKNTNTRYAPSPTGFFHLGGARTAIFNYLYAKKNHGNFILRIEDTDVGRNHELGIDSQFENLKWLKIFPDESFKNPGINGPYLQSQKLLSYKKLAYQLLDQGLAYRCFCTTEELEKYREEAKLNRFTPHYSRKCRNLNENKINELLDKEVPFVIRLKMDPTKIFTWNDLIRDEISFPATALSDFVILRSNEIPTYNFAVVVDDYDMQITHVLRGEEHIANTPYQIAVYEALGWLDKMPQFGHLSIIVNENGKKLSKRDMSIQLFIEDYRNLGYLPEAMVNFLALLGWSGKENQEIMDLKEMIEAFDLTKLSKSPCFFDRKKLDWMSSQYFKKLTPKAYWNFVSDFFDVDLGDFNDLKEEIALLFQKQISYAQQLNQLAKDLFIFKDNEMEQIIKNHRQLLLDSKDIMLSAKELFINKEEWSISKIRAFLKQIMDQTQKKSLAFFLPLRLVFSLKEHGPELFKIMYLMGYDRCLERLNKIINWLETNQ